MTRPLPRLAGLLAAALVAAVPSPAAAQRTRSDPFDQPQVTVGQNGSELFQAALQLAGLQPVPGYAVADHTFDRRRLRNTVLVVIGAPPNRAAWGPVVSAGVDGYQHAEPVLRAGGAVLIATDTDWHWEEMIPVNEVRISSLRVRLAGSSRVHQGRADSPFLEPVARLDARLPPRTPLNELFQGLRRVATENPASVFIPWYRGEYQQPLARFPDGAYFENGSRPDPNFHPFAVGGVGPDRDNPASYRFLLLADQAVIYNRLVADPTTDNLELTRRIVRFLKDPDGANRTHCVFIENGRVVERFDTAERYVRESAPLPPLPPLPPLGAVLMALQDRLVDAGNKAVEELQRRDVFNQALLGSSRNPDRQARTLRGILGGLFVAASVWAVVFLLRRVWRTRQPADVPRPPGPVKRPDPGRPAGVFDRRERELLRRNNLYEPVRDLIRELFAAAGAPHDPGRRPPPVEFEGNPRKSERLRKAIEDLWRVGYGRPVPVPVARWQELEPQLEMVRRAFADGAWRFAPAARPA
jgi:hypothetical protein